MIAAISNWIFAPPLLALVALCAIAYVAEKEARQ